MPLLASFLLRGLACRERLQAPSYDVLALGLRGLFGWQFFLAGRGKLMNLARTSEFFTSLHIPAPGAHALGIGLLECVGGLLLILGAGTRAISAMLSATMIVALATAHRADLAADGIDGLFAAAPFPYLIVTLILLAAGPGRLALDTLIVRRANRACPSAEKAR